MNLYRVDAVAGLLFRTVGYFKARTPLSAMAQAARYMAKRNEPADALAAAEQESRK